jgi:hypothetical protein
MRTFPRQLAEFRRLIHARGAALRHLSAGELLAAGAGATEHIEVQGRRATISIIVQTAGNGSLRVVVQGCMKARFPLPGSSVALDGFYKLPDGAIVPMPEEEFYGFG